MNQVLRGPPGINLHAERPLAAGLPSSSDTSHRIMFEGRHVEFKLPKVISLRLLLEIDNAVEKGRRLSI